MLSTIDLRGRALSVRELRHLLPRAEFDVATAVETVRPICEDVRRRGATALYELGERFDGVRPATLRLPEGVLASALATLDPQVRGALDEAIRRVRIVHEDQRRSTTTTTVVPGGEVSERWIAVDRVGLYVPGGHAVYPSSVVMNVVPAQIAGVGSLAVASPPSATTPVSSPATATRPSSRRAHCWRGRGVCRGWSPGGRCLRLRFRGRDRRGPGHHRRL